jgi:hypothetical protein
VTPLTSAGSAAPPSRRGGASARDARGLRGIAATETLLAAPVVLLMGLGIVQFGLLFHGRHAVSHAAFEAVRAGAVDHASAQAIERGFARGLAPWLYGADAPEGHARAQELARSHLAQGRAAGWAGWRRISPTRESFADWARTARDAFGEPIAGLREIPNDNLAIRIGALQPASGVAGYRGQEPIGNASGQTLADANLLKVEFTYGVPLTVPLAGRLAAWVMRTVDGCDTGAAASKRLGAVDLGTATASGSARAWACAHYDARGEGGEPRPRWPVRVSAIARMQSPARDEDAAPARAAQPLRGPSPGNGTVDPDAEFAPVPIDDVNPDGVGPTEDGSIDRAPGFLKLGGDRLFAVPTACAGP